MGFASGPGFVLGANPSRRKSLGTGYVDDVPILAIARIAGKRAKDGGVSYTLYDQKHGKTYFKVCR